MVFTSAGQSVVSLAGYGATRNAIQTPGGKKKSFGGGRDEKHAAYSHIA